MRPLGPNDDLHPFCFCAYKKPIQVHSSLGFRSAVAVAQLSDGNIAYEYLEGLVPEFRND